MREDDFSDHLSLPNPNVDYVSDTNTPRDIHTQNKRGQNKKIKNPPWLFCLQNF